MKVQPVILCGGSGTRLWPLSRQRHPKQLLALNGELTLAALKARAGGEDPVLAVMPADHVMTDVEAFGEAARAGTQHAADGRFVTFGISPSEPHSGYGYIHSVDAVRGGLLASSSSRNDRLWKAMRPRLKPWLVLLCALWSGAGIAAEEAAAPTPAPAETLETVPEETSTVLPAPVPEGVPSLQMSTDYGSPILALGGYRPMGEIQGGAIRIEPFTIRGGVQAGIGYNDNVTLSNTNKQSSMFLTVSPSLAIGLEGATQRYYLFYRGNYGAYPGSSRDDYDEHNIGVSAANQWGSRLRTLVRYEFVEGQNPRGSTSATLTDAESWRVNALRGTISYGAAGAPGRIEANAGYINRKYTGSAIAGAARDYEQFDAGGAFYWRVAPKTQALTEIRRSEITHDADPTLDSTEMRYLIGARWEATAKTSGTLRAGYLTRDFATSTRSDFTGLTYEAAVTWTPLSYSAVNVAATRTTSEGVEAGSPFLIDHLASIAWTHAWSDRVRTMATYLYGQQDHQAVGRTDRLHALGLRATYGFQRKLRFGAEFRHDTRSSPAPLLDYNRNITLVTVEASL